MKHVISIGQTLSDDNSEFTLFDILRELGFNGSQKVWVVSDHHFDHRFIAGLRGYIPADEEERDDNRYESFEGAWRMNDDMVSAHNAVVDDADFVVDLGDVTSGSVRPLPNESRLRGRKVLIAGNHDNIWSRLKRLTDKSLRPYLREFEAIVSKGSIMLGDGGDPVVVSHLPVIGDSHDYETRYDRMRTPATPEGAPVICGHVHDAWEVNGKNLNVGVDFGFTPTLLSEAVDRARSLSGVGALPTDKSVDELGE